MPLKASTLTLSMYNSFHSSFCCTVCGSKGGMLSGSGLNTVMQIVVPIPCFKLLILKESSQSPCLREAFPALSLSLTRLTFAETASIA